MWSTSLLSIILFLLLLQAESNGGLSVLENHHPEVKEHYVRKRKGLKKQKKYLELDFNDENVSKKETSCLHIYQILIWFHDFFYVGGCRLCTCKWRGKGMLSNYHDMIKYT